MLIGKQNNGKRMDELSYRILEEDAYSCCVRMLQISHGIRKVG